MINLFEEYSESELLLTNVTFLGLDQGSWVLDRGQRQYRDYTSEDTLRVRDSYVYTMSSSNKNIEGMSRMIQWYKQDGTVGLTKTIKINTTPESLKKLNREIRQNRMDFLESGAENLRNIASTLPPVEPYVTQAAQLNQVADSIDLLFTHYAIQIAEYIQRGTTSFEDALSVETNPTILAILAIPVRAVDEFFPNGLTAKQSIQYQIDGTVP